LYIDKKGLIFGYEPWAMGHVTNWGKIAYNNTVAETDIAKHFIIKNVMVLLMIQTENCPT
jgi:hypothetical protein